jgi:hypothetical protein
MPARRRSSVVSLPVSAECRVKNHRKILIIFRRRFQLQRAPSVLTRPSHEPEPELR